MDSNMFSGKLEDGFLHLNELTELNISSNSLTGAIPTWMGNLTSLHILVMSDNLFKGTIPIPLFEAVNLFLDLSGNMLSGTLPSYYNPAVGVTGMLYLQNNDLTGPIPNTLLSNVEILDLRNNKLYGSVPQFVNTQNISILLLRGNNLTGNFPIELCELSNIRLLDLADNKFKGSIPSCLKNVSFGSRDDVEQPSNKFEIGSYDTMDFPPYSESTLLVYQFGIGYDKNLEAEIQFAAKQRYDSYTRGSLGFMFGLDLSNNELSGEIPKEFRDLQKLRALNLSHNHLSGSIPESFSNMKGMESLDLCFNGLSGQILPQLAGLNSLSVFNVSYNNLSGAIPQEGQFSTFNETNYIGNPLLCGPPTNRSCNVNGSETPNNYGRKYDEAADDMVIFAWSFLATYMTVLMGIVVFLCFDSTWSRGWFRLVDAFISSMKTLWSRY